MAGTGHRFPRTLYVIQAAEPSGAETALAPLLAADPDPLVACPAGSATAAYVRSLGVPVVDLPFRVLRHSGGRALLARSLVSGLRSALELRRITRARPERELIYANSLRPGMLVTLGGIGLRRRLAWAMTDRLPPPPLRQAIRLLTALSGAQVIAHSQYLADDFHGGSPLLRRRVTVVHPGVDRARFAGAPSDLPSDPAFAPPSEPSAVLRPARAAIVGHVSPTKQTALALDIAARVAAQRPDFRLDVVGEAQYREEDFAYHRALRDRIAADPALARVVTLHGRRGDLENVFGGVAMLLHCRPDEPFGMVLIEAMAAGLPVVAPAAGGPLEIVEHGRTGLLYPPGDAESAAELVLELLADPQRALALGQAGRSRVGARFDATRQLGLLREALVGP